MKDNKFRFGIQEMLLAALAVVTVVLAVFALTSDRHRVSTESPTQTDESDLPVETPSASTGTSPAPSATQGSSAVAVVAGVNPAGVLLRAAASGCAEGAAKAVIATTLPGSDTRLVEIDGLGTITGLLPSTDDTLRAIGADASCAPVGYASDDAGASWREVEDLPLFWSILPGASERLQTPAGETEVNCTPVTVSGLDRDVARVWCDTGQILGTVDGGEAWAILGRHVDASAVVFTSTETGYALVERDTCDGVVVHVSTNGGSRWEETRCIDGEGPWTLAAARGRVAVVSAEEAWTSTDAETWDRL